MKKLLSFLLAFAMLLCCAAAETAQSGYAGRWTCHSVEYNGQSIPMQQFGAYVTLLLNADGTYGMLNNGLHVSGTWTETESGLAISDADFGELPLSAGEDTITLSVMGRSLIFGRDLPLRANVAEAELVGTWVMTEVYGHGTAYTQEEAIGLTGFSASIELGEDLTGKTCRWSDTERVELVAQCTLTGELEGLGTQFNLIETTGSGEFVDRFTLFLLEDGRIELVDESDTALYFTKQMAE